MPIPMNNNRLTLRISSVDAMHELATTLLNVLRKKHPRAVIFLEGDLGAGKTTFVRGFLRAAEFNGHVKSPTYTLLEPYHLTNLDVYHLDLYRLKSPEELEDIGLRDIIDDSAYFLIEWPLKESETLFDSDIELNITVDGAVRNIDIVSNSSIGQEIVQAIRQK